MKFSIFERRNFLIIIQKSNILCICAVSTYKIFTMENETFLALQGVPIKASHFHTKITLKMLGKKLSFDGFEMVRAIFIQLYGSH